MILKATPIKILEINSRSEKINAIRFDKGSPSPVIPSKINRIIGEKIITSFKGEINKYPNLKGHNPLIELIRNLELKINKRLVNDNEICITNGALSGLFLILAFLCKKLDRIILNDLSFEGFPSVIATLGLLPIYANYADRKQLEEKIKKYHPPILILNSPENPSGKIYSADFLDFLGYLSIKYDLYIISDEVNNQNIYQPYAWIPPSKFISKKYLITLNSASKNYFLPGLRLGWIISNKAIASKIREVFCTFQVGVNFLSQILTTLIINKFQQEISKYKKSLHKNKILMEKILTEENITFLKPVQAGYVFFINTNVNSEQLSKTLLEKYKVGLIPGVYFGEKWSTWIRLGFGAVSESDIKNNIPLLAKIVKQSKK